MVTKLETPTERVEPSLMVFDRLADAREDWFALRETAAVSPYQNYDFVAAWFETIGRARHLEPMIVVARGSDGRPLALFPLATHEAAGLGVAEFLGGRESNFNIGLFHPGDSLDWRGLLLAAARGRPNPPDLLYLRNQPRGFGAFENPLLGGDACPSPSFAYGTALARQCRRARLSKLQGLAQEAAQKGKAADGAWRARLRAWCERRARGRLSRP
jgi:CelD/BcsL family acetyltransferase involved in cellulose biosynthesis